jgi:hypothetical protein
MAWYTYASRVHVNLRLPITGTCTEYAAYRSHHSDACHGSEAITINDTIVTYNFRTYLSEGAT